MNILELTVVWFALLSFHHILLGRVVTVMLDNMTVVLCINSLT